MEYFVSIENTNYCAWQAEILIESFKKQNLNEFLSIGVAATDLELNPKYNKNLQSHRRKTPHINVGRQHGYLPLNRLYALALTTEMNLIQQPFVVMHSDMLLYNPVTEMGPFILLDESDQLVPMKRIELHVDNLHAIKQVEMPHKAFNSVMVFNNMPYTFFRRAYQWGLRLFRETQDTSWDIESAAWLLTAYEHCDLFSCTYKQMTTEINHLIPSNFVHYKRGLDQRFHKYNFMYQDGISFDADPYRAILEQPDVKIPGIKLLQELVKSLG